MAKTIKEILKNLSEWKKANDKKRCVLLIVGFENEEILIKILGQQSNLTTCVTSSMVNCAEFKELTTSALKLANKNTLQEEEE